ncbi:MAG: polysaccharide deacetylase family protein [Bacteroidetes bacterium]|nr:polysaccharide deacetylase family protein [Bacteroidota bacterium]
MAKTTIVAFCALVVILGFNTGCKKFEKQGQLQDPGIVLTFDDNMVDNWYSYLPLLDSAGVKATFYICKYNRFTNDQKRKLQEIKKHGHEIAFHTTNHYNMEDYVYKQKHTIDDLMRCEVEAGLKLMNQDGFYPTTFAYPYGAHNGVFDKMLLRYFKSVRALNGTQDYSKSIVPTEKNNLLYGLGIDKSSRRSDQDINSVMESAKDNRACVIFVAHDINTASKYATTLHRLMQILNFAKKHNLKYYTVSEISG